MGPEPVDCANKQPQQKSANGDTGKAPCESLGNSSRQLLLPFLRVLLGSIEIMLELGTEECSPVLDGHTEGGFLIIFVLVKNYSAHWMDSWPAKKPTPQINQMVFQTLLNEAFTRGTLPKLTEDGRILLLAWAFEPDWTSIGPLLRSLLVATRCLAEVVTLSILAGTRESKSEMAFITGCTPVATCRERPGQGIRRLPRSLQPDIR